MQSTTFKPRNDFSQNLLTSIPVKVSAWLRNLDMLKTQKGSLGPLSWRIRNNNGKSFIKIGDTHIQWQGPIGNIGFVQINQSWADDIAKNMDQFVALEKSIYDEIQKVEDALLEANKFEIEIPSRDRILQTLQTA